MNKYVFVLIVCAVVFLVCFLIDSLLKLLFPKSRLEKSKQVVRPPRRSAVIGVILTYAGAAKLVKPYASKESVEALPAEMERLGIGRLRDIVGCVE